MKLKLSHMNIMVAVGGDVYLIVATSVRTRRSVSIDLRERRWKVNGTIGGRLDVLDVAAETAAHHGMK